MSYEERVASPCIGAERADLVLAGCAILEAIRRAFPCPRLRVADRGLREGMLVQMMREDGVWGGGDQVGGVVTARGKERRPARAEGPGQDRQGPQAVLQAVAGAPAQRSLRRARQARGLSLARRLQADRDRRQGALLEERRARDRSRRRARRLEPGGGQARRRAAGRAASSAIDILPMEPIAGVDFVQLDFLDAVGAGQAESHARRSGRRGAVRHGGQRHRPSPRPIT